MQSKINYPFLNSPRCGARTRRGSYCQSPAVKGKNRCRMHGGAKGSGAPKGSQNALKHGFYTKGAIGERHQIRNLVRDSKKLMALLFDEV